jgi:enterobacteria phage integrase
MNLSRIIAATVGIVSPRYRTLGQWAEIYRQVIDGRPIDEKTKANRRSSINHIIKRLGADRIISGIKPHEIASMVMCIYKDHPQLAKRVLIEAKDLFGEALNYAWLDRNPATQIKAPSVRVQRKRLTLDQWQQIHDHAEKNMPPWVARMMTLALVTGQRRSDVVKMQFSDVWDDWLHIEQVKTGARLALPVSLRLDAIGVSVGGAVEACRSYNIGDDYLIRKSTGKPLDPASLSARFEEARDAVLPRMEHPPSLHECRSLSERLYRAQGIDTMTLLGHKHQSMTDLYNDDRGLTRGVWRELAI